MEQSVYERKVRHISSDLKLWFLKAPTSGLHATKVVKHGIPKTAVSGTQAVVFRADGTKRVASCLAMTCEQPGLGFFNDTIFSHFTIQQPAIQPA